MARVTLLSLVLLSTACGGSAGMHGDSGGPSGAGSMHVVVDTATGSDGLVQFQIVGATLDRRGGASTGNLLAAPVLLTLADPSGEPDALVLPNVPAGDYTALHLAIAPGSGALLPPDGRVQPVDAAVELVVPFAEDVAHSGQRSSWVEIGHDDEPPLANRDSATWAPVMSGRPSDSACTLTGLCVAAVQSSTLVVQWSTAADAPLEVAFGEGCVFADGMSSGSGAMGMAGGHMGGNGHRNGGGSMNGGHMGSAGHDFLAVLGRGNYLTAEGDLRADGRFTARSLRRHGNGPNGPRLMGRIAELRPAAAAFVLDVHAELRAGARRLLPAPRQVLVLADGARLTASHGSRPLAFAELRTGQLAKVEWTSRAPGAGGREEVIASAIEVAGDGVRMRPAWHGSVQSVEVARGRIVAVPAGHPIVVQGLPVAEVAVEVDAGTVIERSERGGPARTTIALGDIVPGQDRIWWRGTVTGPGSIAATWVRVRRDG